MVEAVLPPERPTTWLTILGVGEDGVEGLGPAARTLLAGAEFVIGGARHLALVEPLVRCERMAWPRPFGAGLDAILARRGRAVVVLASGDPFDHGVGVQLAALVPAEEFLCLPAPSAISLACARLGWARQETATISLCGRPLARLAPLLQPGRKVLALSADATTPAVVAAYLAEWDFGDSRLHVLEALGGPQERVRSRTAEDFDLADCGPLNLLGIEVEAGAGAHVLPLAPGLDDELFEHDGQITKREIRAITLSALAPLAGQRLWDIGCGSGSISIEWMLRHPANTAIAFEADPQRAARAARNATALGVPDLHVVEGRAPEVLADQPQPDAVFLGGGAHLPGVIETAWAALRPGGRMVANAVAVETQTTLLAAHTTYGGTLTRLSVERLDTLGTLHAFRPALAVIQWSAVKP